jgi:hypothetical protein
MTFSKAGYEVIDFVKDLLKIRFKRDPLKSQVNCDTDGKLNFACPYCGDSETDRSKKRGNLYINTGSYKCFNDGCLKWAPLSKFISEFSLRYSLPIPDFKKEEAKIKIDVRSKRASIFTDILDPRVNSSLLKIEDLADRFFLSPCKDAPHDSEIWQYIKDRKLTDLPGFENSCYYDRSQEKIFIFNLDYRSGKVLGLSMRKTREDLPGPKYNIKTYSDFKEGRLIDLSDDLISKIDRINGFFNIMNVDFSRPIIILEGQLDSMFIRNSMAISGVSKSKKDLKNIVPISRSFILFDNDKAGRSAAIEMIQSGYRVFLWSKLVADLRREFPDLRKEINVIKDINDLYVFFNDHSGLTLDQFNDRIFSYFSESAYDLISI